MPKGSWVYVEHSCYDLCEVQSNSVGDSLRSVVDTVCEFQTILQTLRNAGNVQKIRHQALNTYSQSTYYSIHRITATVASSYTSQYHNMALPWQHIAMVTKENQVICACHWKQTPEGTLQSYETVITIFKLHLPETDQAIPKIHGLPMSQDYSLSSQNNGYCWSAVPTKSASWPSEIPYDFGWCNQLT